MTFGILKARAYGPYTSASLRVNILSQGFEFWEYFDEHKYNPLGFVFMEKDLVAFVLQRNVDPAEIEGHPLKNYTDIIVRLPPYNLIVISVKHKFFQHKIIKKNYDRYEVYIKK